MSKRDQRVTQWMSVRISTDGSSRNASHESSSGSSTAPEVRNVQVARSARRGMRARLQHRPLGGGVLARRQARGSTPIASRLALGRGAEESHAATVAQRRVALRCGRECHRPRPRAAGRRPCGRRHLRARRARVRARVRSRRRAPAAERRHERHRRPRGRRGPVRPGADAQGQAAGGRLDRARGRRRVRVRLRGRRTGRSDRHAAALPPRFAGRHRRRDRRADAARAAARGARRGLARGAARSAAAGRSRDCAARPGRRRSPPARCRSAPTRARRCASSRACRASGSTSTAPTCRPRPGVVERAVSFTKGCYIGQEPIVRLAHRGHANRELRRLRLDEPLELPATLLDERARGRPRDEQRRVCPRAAPRPSATCAAAVADGAALVALDARGERVAARDAGRVAAGRP